MPVNLYTVKTKEGDLVAEGVRTSEVAEKTGCAKANIWNAANYRALVNEKYYIEIEDVLLNKNKDAELLKEWNRHRKWFLRAARRKRRQKVRRG